MLLSSRRSEETVVNPKATVVAFAIYFAAVAAIFVTAALLIGGSLGA